MSEQLFGVCHFDDQDQALTGWASVNGQPAFRVNNRGDLSSDVVWVTNLLWRKYCALNLYRQHNLRHDQFFRNSYTLYAREYGLEGSVQAKVEFFSNIFTRVSSIAEMITGESLASCDYRVPGHLRDKILDSSYFRRPQGADSINIINAIKQSSQQIQTMNGRAPAGSKTYNYNFPRGAYARWILTLGYPNGENWKKLQSKNFTGVFGYEDGQRLKGTDGIVSKLIDLGETKAVFFRISVLSQSPEFIDYQSFGSGSSYQRKWITLPELIHICRFSKVKIEGGYQTDLSSLEMEIGVNPDEDEYSITRSIFLDALWVGIASDLNTKPKYTTAVAAYMRSYDRIACAKVAEKFVNDGAIKIGSFGTGRVTAYINPNQIDLAKDIAIEQGMLPPLGHLMRDAQ